MVTLLPSGLCIVRVRLKSSASGIWLKTHIVESHKIISYVVHWFVHGCAELGSLIRTLISLISVQYSNYDDEQYGADAQR